ncbi:phosphoenolpyruvate--protein phosphotransferase [Kocuria sp. M1R5S2]|uniref:phosphoenolpyruvate--protein phosphotransferase n=1 Tax=Kocuria rhizosphaerae TaxID=3376285 RepID=UPI0037A0A6BB
MNTTSSTTTTGPLQGVGVCPGRVVGPVRHMPPALAEPTAELRPLNDEEITVEVQRLKEAGATVAAALRARAESVSPEAAEVLAATALMATDSSLHKGARRLMRDGLSTERALWEAAAQVADTLTGLGGYMAERAADVLDVRSRILAQLRGVPAPGIPLAEGPFVLAAEDLAPADTAVLDPAHVLALITSQGGPQSHTAILARALGIPAVVAVPGLAGVLDGELVYVDGAAGVVTPDPPPELVGAAQAWQQKKGQLGVFDGAGVTADGHEVPLLANVGGAEDAVAAAAAGAQGVGLLRTEFCFLGHTTEPTVAEQTEKYRGVFAAFPGQKVVVRTLDAGADKPLPFLTDAAEPNPALGVRGLRTDRTSPGVLARQLEAIAAAAGAESAEVWVMAPMLSTPAEAQAFAALCAEHGLPTPGVMIEVPAAALTAPEILTEVAFASVGTNDLTQYVMAADRQLSALAEFNDPWQPALLRLVRTAADGAQATGKPLGVCGEAASDPALAVVLTGLGVTSLSMSPRSLAAVAAVLRTVTLDEAQQLARAALSASSAHTARQSVRDRLPELTRLGL